MRVSTAVALLFLAPAARAQVRIEIALPSIRFEVAPPLVVVSPGVQVVQDYEDEVYFTGGWYWVAREGVWFRTRDHRGGWERCERRRVPAYLLKSPPGRYRHYRGPPGHFKRGPPPAPHSQASPASSKGHPGKGHGHEGKHKHGRGKH